MFATALVAYLDRPGHRLLAASAGHCPLFIFQSGRGEAQRIEASGPPLGVLPDVGYSSEEAILERGARALLYTDGVTELANPEGEMLGEDGLTRWFTAAHHAGQNASTLKRSLAEELVRFQRGLQARDDQTFILLTHDTP
jgi:serine phosphatase RsbU (regulator of sigma subunit)